MRGLTCVYPKSYNEELDSSALVWQPADRPTSATISESLTSAQSLAVARRVPDALLWQYYLSYASESLAATDGERAYSEMWRSSIPAAAYCDPATSHALMALSAFCMSTQEAHEGIGSFDVPATAQLHYWTSLKYMQSSLAAPERANADALLACSLLLIPCGLALSRRSHALRGWIHHLRGFKAVGNSAQLSDTVEGSQTHLIPYPQHGRPDHQIVVADCGQSTMSVTPLLDSIRLSRFEAVNELWAAVAKAEPTCSVVDVNAYTAAIDEMECIMDHLVEHGASSCLRAIFSWTTQIPSRFVELMETRDELALAIAAHWVVTTLLLDDIWFLTGFGAFRIEYITDILEARRSPYFYLLDWPREILKESRLMKETLAS